MVEAITALIVVEIEDEKLQIGVMRFRGVVLAGKERVRGGIMQCEFVEGLSKTGRSAAAVAVAVAAVAVAEEESSASMFSCSSMNG